MQKTTLVVMAAGIGSRYGGLKQIDPVGPSGEIIIDYSVYDALVAGFKRVVFVVREDIRSALQERVDRSIAKRCDTAYVIQRIEDVPTGFAAPPAREKPWGTGHAILRCKDVVDAPFAVINADDFYGRSSYRTLCDYLQHAQDRDGVYDYSMVGYPLEKTLSEHGDVTRGVCTVNEEGFLMEIDERAGIEKSDRGARYSEDRTNWVAIPPGRLVSMNMWGFTPSLFPELEARFAHFLAKNGRDLKAEFLLPNLIGDLVAEKKARVKVLSTDAQWFGVTYQQDRPRVKRAIGSLIQERLYPADLWKGEE